MQPKPTAPAEAPPQSVTEQIDAFWKRASWSNSALNPSLLAAPPMPDLTVDLMTTPEMLIMQHKMRNPRYMDDAVRWKLIQQEIAAQAQGGN